LIFMHDLNETIVAIATPPGRGGVGCVRLSGPRAGEIAGALFRVRGGKQQRAAGPPRFGRFLDRRGRHLDHGYLVLFAAGRSFTGEGAAELWTHGSPAVLAELVRGAQENGARAAGPGEFTYRALRNGRLDLSRAEAIDDLVRARTIHQARVAFSQVEGSVARRVGPLREMLEEWIARAETAVEFVDESETQLPRDAFTAAIDEARGRCAVLVGSYDTGKILRDGASLAIVGLPNVGKSSMFNRLLQRERAIVTSIPGTTRDTLEEELDLDGIPVRLVDTAGMRAVTDPVETEGVRRARIAREEADLVLLVLDGSRGPAPAEEEALERAGREPERSRTFVVVNKADLEHERKGPDPYADRPRVSALTGDRVEDLRAALRRRLVGTGSLEDPMITNARQAAALEKALRALDRSAAAQRSGLSEELVLEELRLARERLAEITGAFDNEELYEKIFSTFCIGK
jgi:tRNA modification GTPase